ncbi:hypothetical protein AAFF_G00209230 [Aldrovandia affinis]|uniref:Uncharacterized protein n=1 Tax=Aldrovandia affinis TaxID=143900 RepID=A0AAD7SXD0_9TELE|nr:hypothetical protein AAFF_G00209230 [Aldrovandia affinis]
MSYHAFLNSEDKGRYEDIVNGILQKRGVQEASRIQIKELGNRSENFTNERKMRKVRIGQKMHREVITFFLIFRSRRTYFQL